MASELRYLVEQLKAVSHPMRLRVLALVHGGELCVCQVAAVLQIPQSSVSEALRELRRAGFVNERKEGRWVYVSGVPEADASPLLKGILSEALSLPEAEGDRARVELIRSLPTEMICKVQRADASELSCG